MSTSTLSPRICRASIGSISAGTLQPRDLVSAFAAELEWLLDGNAVPTAAMSAGWSGSFHALAANANDWMTADDDLADDGSELVAELCDALEAFAPPYCYFGAIEGDGADFGFWPSWDAIEDLKCVSDPAEVENHLGEDCQFVNDHGNVTVYGSDGTVLLEIV